MYVDACTMIKKCMLFCSGILRRLRQSVHIQLKSIRSSVNVLRHTTLVVYHVSTVCLACSVGVCCGWMQVAAHRLNGVHGPLRAFLS